MSAELMVVDESPTFTELNRKIDALTLQVEFLAEHAYQQQQRQREWDELKTDLTPIMNDVYQVAVEQMAELEPHVNLDDVMDLLKRLARNTRTIEQMLDQLESLSDLVKDVMPIVNDAFLAAVTKLDEMERKGYFEAMREGAYVADNIVEAFGPEDVRQLGDNVVTILTTVKEMTQPEVMETVQSLTNRMREVEERPETINTSFFGLFKQMRDPEVRRGLGVTLQMLKAIGEESPGANGK
ncbi:MAG: DUF1641 domain-containing protein [Caldilineales bacterium]|nr:DUF1641 domain-containing protein [Caldilineales bacterium]